MVKKDPVSTDETNEELPFDSFGNGHGDTIPEENTLRLVSIKHKLNKAHVKKAESLEKKLWANSIKLYKLIEKALAGGFFPSIMFDNFSIQILKLNNALLNKAFIQTLEDVDEKSGQDLRDYYFKYFVAYCSAHHHKITCAKTRDAIEKQKKINSDIKNEIDKFAKDIKKELKGYLCVKDFKFEIASSPPVTVQPFQDFYYTGFDKTITGNILPDDVIPLYKIKSESSIRNFVSDNSLRVIVDLSYDKDDIMESFEEVITLAQKATGKNPGKGKRKYSQTRLVQEIIENIFRGKYKPGKVSSEVVLEEISDYLEKYGIKINGDTIKRKYLPRIKGENGVKSLKELYKKWHK